MPGDDKSKGAKQPGSSEKKMVPEADLIAVKNASAGREKKLREELTEKTKEVAELKAELKMAKTNLEDEGEVAEVRQYLIDEGKRIEAEKAELEQDRASIKQRERDADVKALAEKHGVEIDQIKDAEDPEKEALKIVNERLAEGGGGGEEFFESKSPGGVRQQPKDMSDEDFEKHVKGMEQEAVSKQ